jgi:hypothetical protein
MIRRAATLFASRALRRLENLNSAGDESAGYYADEAGNDLGHGTSAVRLALLDRFRGCDFARRCLGRLGRRHERRERGFHCVHPDHFCDARVLLQGDTHGLGLLRDSDVEIGEIRRRLAGISESALSGIQGSAVTRAGRWGDNAGLRARSEIVRGRLLLATF